MRAVEQATRTPPWTWVALASALPVAAAAVIHFQLLGAGTSFSSTIAQLAAAVAAAAACLLTSRHHAGRPATGWLLMAVACASWAIGQSVGLLQEGFRYVWGAGLQDIFFTAFFPLAAASLVYMAPRLGTAEALRASLDGVAVSMSTLIVLWASGFDEVYAQSTTHADLFVFILYPVGDVVLMALATVLWTRTPPSARIFPLSISAAFAMLLVADANFFYLESRGGHGAGSTLDALWIAGFLWIGAAALWAGRTESPSALEVRPPTRWATYAAYLPALPVVAAAIAYATNRDGPVSGIYIAMLVVWFVALQARHFILVREHASLTAQAMEQEKWFRSLTENATDAIAVFDRDAKRVFTSASSLRLFGYGAGELAGSTAFTIIHDDDQKKAQAAFLEATLKPREPILVDLRVRRKDGSYVRVKTTVVSRLDDPVVKGIITTSRDIEQDMRAEAERLARVRAEADVAAMRHIAEVKTAFMNTAAHELRTPLTPVRAAAKLIRRRTEQGRAPDPKSVEILERGVDRIGRIAEDLLDSTRLQSGKLEMHMVEFDMAGIVQQSVAAAEPVAKETGIALSYEGPQDMLAYGDAQRLAQVLDNLLDNSLKFTPKGGSITVRLRRRVRGVEQGAHVEVQDTGLGFDPSMRAQLFEVFSQGPEAAQARRPGTGLGLYICREMVWLHKGGIGADSEGPGKGAQVWFWIP
jgi:PAS domain S-box-containing protein